MCDEMLIFAKIKVYKVKQKARKPKKIDKCIISNVIFIETGLFA